MRAALMTAVMLHPGCEGSSGGITAIRPLGEAVETVAEYITVACEDEQSACMLPCPSDDLYVAINPYDYAGSQACGACMEVEGPLGNVTVKVTQNCAGACAPDEIELSETAFALIADTSEGHAPVVWRLVSCAVSGPLSFHFEPESTEWWVSIQVRNHAVPVASVEMLVDKDLWIDLPRQMHNYFEAEDPGPGPYTLRVTSVDKQQIVEADVPLSPGGVVQGTDQFR